MAIIESKVLTEHVYERIRQMIVDGALAPGERINKRKLETTLGVSQTPINEALSRLVGERFIEQETRRGYYVTRIGIEQIARIFEYRAATEGLAARLCAENASEEDRRSLAAFFSAYSTPIAADRWKEYERADDAFHRRVLDLSGNPMLAAMNETHGYMLKSYKRGLIRDADETLEEHQTIVKAILFGKPVEAQEAMTSHLLTTRNAFLKGRVEEVH